MTACLLHYMYISFCCYTMNLECVYICICIHTIYIHIMYILINSLSTEYVCITCKAECGTAYCEGHISIWHIRMVSVSMFQCLSFIAQSQNFQVLFERPSLRVLQARITYPQPLPFGYDFEVVFFSAGQKIHTAEGVLGTNNQVILISLDNVDTLSPVTARMEFEYSEDRFAGPEVTASIPVFCK